MDKWSELHDDYSSVVIKNIYEITRIEKIIEQGLFNTYYNIFVTYKLSKKGDLKTEVLKFKSEVNMNMVYYEIKKELKIYE